MITIKSLLIKKENRKPNTQYMYYRVEGNGLINNGTTSQEERYSVKTGAIEEYWYDVSCAMDVSEKARPDDKFHKWLKQTKCIYPVQGRDLFDSNELARDKFEKYLIEYINEQLGLASANIAALIQLRAYQEDGGKALIDFINSKKQSFLLEAITGYGKTATCYYALQNTNLSTIAIVTNRITTNEAWIKDFKTFGLDSQGFALKTPDYTIGNWIMAQHHIILAPSRDNKIFKNEKVDLWVSDEAHLRDGSNNAKDFYKDKRILYITATGNKFVNRIDDFYYVGYTDMAQWIEAGIISKNQFIIPTMRLYSKYQDWDFSKLKNYTDIQLEDLLKDIVEKATSSNFIENSMIVCQSRCENGYKLYEIAKKVFPGIKWYVSTEGNRSASYANNKRVKNGPVAIKMFNRDCEEEPNIVHILITVYQGKESVSYYDLQNVFMLCDKSSVENFIQVSGRLTRPKKNTNRDEAVFYLYSPFINICTTIQNMYEKDCKKKGIPFTQEGLDQFVRMFHIFVDDVPQTVSAVTILNEISLHGDLLRNSPKSDLDLIVSIYGGTKDGKSSLVNGEKRPILGASSKKKTSSNNKSNKTDEELMEETSEKDYITAKKRFDETVLCLPFYFRYLEYYKAHPEKINSSNRKHFEELVANYNYPSKIDDLRHFPKYNFQSIVFNFATNQQADDLFSQLSDNLLENVLKRIIANKSTPLTELAYALYSPHTKTAIANGRISTTAFTDNFIPHIKAVNKNGKVLCIRIGIDSVLLLKKLGFTNIVYYTDIVAEKFIFDSYNIENKYIKQINGKEDWEATVQGLDMDFDLIIMNPPYDKNLHLKVLSEAIKHISNTGKVINLSPVRWLQDPFAKHKKTSDYFRFEDTISKHINTLEILSNKEMEEQFDIHLYTNLGIYVCDSKGGFNYADVYKQNRSVLELRILDECTKLDNIKNHMETSKRDGIRVLLALIAGGRGNLPVYKDLAYVINGYKDGKDWTECKQNKGLYTKAKGSDIPNSIKFDTEIEAQNFYDSYKTTFSKWLCDISTLDQHIQVQFLPFMNDYTKIWNNKEFCDYFKITGYISDTEAEKDSEWAEILNHFKNN